MSPDVKKRLLKVRVASSQPAAPHVRSVRLLEQGLHQLDNTAVEMHLVQHVAPLCTAIRAGGAVSLAVLLRTRLDGRLRPCDLGLPCASGQRPLQLQLSMLSLTPPPHRWTVAAEDTRT